jgi:hypothetical protein
MATGLGGTTVVTDGEGALLFAQASYSGAVETVNLPNIL